MGELISKFLIIGYLQWSNRDAIFVPEISKYSNPGCPLRTSRQTLEPKHVTPTAERPHVIKIPCVRLQVLGKKDLKRFRPEQKNCQRHLNVTYTFPFFVLACTRYLSPAKSLSKTLNLYQVFELFGLFASPPLLNDQDSFFTTVPAHVHALSGFLIEHGNKTWWKRGHLLFIKIDIVPSPWEYFGPCFHSTVRACSSRACNKRSLDDEFYLSCRLCECRFSVSPIPHQQKCQLFRWQVLSSHFLRILPKTHLHTVECDKK